MQVSQQSGHLLFVESACKAGHHAATLQHILSDGLVGYRDAAGEGLLVEQPVQVGWNFLQRQVVILIAMGAAHIVEILPFGLLWSERRL